jgi:hypothetical protein
MPGPSPVNVHRLLLVIRCQQPQGLAACFLDGDTVIHTCPESHRLRWPEEGSPSTGTLNLHISETSFGLPSGWRHEGSSVRCVPWRESK